MNLDRIGKSRLSSAMAMLRSSFSLFNSLLLCNSARTEVIALTKRDKVSSCCFGSKPEFNHTVTHNLVVQ